MSRVSKPYPPPQAYPPPPDGQDGDAERPRRPVDLTVTIVLIVLLAGLGLLSLTFGLFLMMASDGCFDDACNNRVALGVLIVEAAPIVAWVPTTVWAVIRMTRRKVAFWVPLLALPVYLGLAVLGLSFLGT